VQQQTLFGGPQPPQPSKTRVSRARYRARKLNLNVRKEGPLLVLMDYEGNDVTGKMTIDELETEIDHWSDDINGCGCQG